jgi:hypothetical protein
MAISSNLPICGNDVAHLNLLDVNLAVAEVERVKGKARGIFTTPVPRNGRPVGDRYYDPILGRL